VIIWHGMMADHLFITAWVHEAFVLLFFPHLATYCSCSGLYTAVIC
jgi:hypothetical protein